MLGDLLDRGYCALSHFVSSSTSQVLNPIPRPIPPSAFIPPPWP